MLFALQNCLCLQDAHQIHTSAEMVIAFQMTGDVILNLTVLRAKMKRTALEVSHHSMPLQFLIALDTSTTN